MGSLGEVEHEHLVGDGLTHGTGQVHRCLLELLRVQNTLHRHDVLLLVRNLDTDGTLAGNRGNDTDAESLQREGDVILQITDFRDTYPLCRCNFVERDGGAYGGLDAVNLNAKVAQHLHDAVLVLRLLLHVDVGLAVVLVDLQQVEGGILVKLQVALGVVGFQHLFAHRNEVLAIGLLFLLAYLDGQLAVLGITGRLGLRGLI